MNKNMRMGLSLILIITISVVAGYYGNVFTGGNLQAQHDNSKPIVEAYIRQLDSHKFDENGKLSTSLIASYSEKLQDNANMHVLQPKLTLKQQPSVWRLQAETADVNTVTNIIIFDDNVLLEREDGMAQLRSPNLHIDIDQEFISSTADVSIFINGSSSYSSGIEMDMRNEIIRLPANVKSQYQPQPKK